MSVGRTVIDQRMAIQRDISAIEKRILGAGEMMEGYEKLHADVSVRASESRQATLKALLADLKKNHVAYVLQLRGIQADLRDQLVKLL